jgi:hypothetical protein
MANVWREPVYDRTLEDVEFAIQKLKEWKQSHTHSTDIRVENDALVVRDESTAYINNDEFVLQGEGVAYVDNDVLIVHVGDVYELKGCLNLLDLNRIEGNIAFLAETMERFSYSSDIHGKQWGRSDIPNQNDMLRIIKNIGSLIDAFYPFNFDRPSLPTTMLSYDDINTIELNLLVIKQWLDVMQTSFKKVGTMKCGSRMILPTRR